jgi:glycerophosphoryl diester phosphodiesterase
VEYVRARPVTAIVLLVVALVVIALASAERTTPRVVAGEPAAAPEVRSFAVIAHHGASAYAPEHTFASYGRALQYGADYIEVDLQMTLDGELIALHDESLDRTTDVEEVFPERSPWLAGAFTLEEIKQLDAGSWFSEEYAGEEVPTLQEVIDLVGDDARLYIETKSPETYPGMEEALVETLDENGLLGTDRVILQSFSPESLQLLRELDDSLFLVQLISPEMVAGEEWESVLDETAEYAAGIGPDKALVDPELVRAAQSRGLVVHPYTVNERAEMLRLLNSGVNGMFTDVPDHLIGILQSRLPVEAPDPGIGRF